ncbi:MAG: outer membrane lipoprotein chaperone LolA [Gammaproteobacteria bacterium]
MPIKYTITAFSALLLCAGAMAATPTPAARLDTLLAATTTLTAHFSETIANANAVTVKQSSGTVAIAKPGRFRWDYEKPYQQIIVADGEKLWIYDPGLEQVTVRNEPQALAAGPASLLAGAGHVAASFDVSGGGSADGLQWIKLVPKTDESDYKAIRIGFTANGVIRAMELDSNLDQTTHIEFSDVKRNAPIAPARFIFTPPPGADVVNQTPAAASAPTAATGGE